MSIIEIRQLFVWFELTNPKDFVNFKYKSWSNNNFVLLTSCLVAIVSYVVIPVLLIMVSLLLILESGSVTDMIKDTLSLLFLNEINNYFQVRNAPEARKWKILLKAGKLRAMTREKSTFTSLLFIGFGFAGYLTFREHISNGFVPGHHPSIYFNNLRRRTLTEGGVGEAAWNLFYFTILAIFGAFFYAKSFVFISDLIYLCVVSKQEEDKEKAGLFYKYVYSPASTFQGFMAETFNPDDDMDDWEEDRIVRSVTYSADGSRLARSEGNDVVVCDVRDAVTGVEIRLKGHR